MRSLTQSPADEAEIAKFTDTGKTIAHRGRVYAIYSPPDDENRAESPFILKSPRGLWYALVRNKPRPDQMFGAGLYGTSKCLDGWFTDKSGELVSLG